MTAVVDTSVVIRLLAAREEDDLLRQRLSRPVYAPHLIDAEVASVVRGLVLTTKPGKQISATRAQEMLADFAVLRIVRHSMRPLQHRVFELRDNFTSYDAMYIALAEALDVPLVTADHKHAAAPAGVHAAEVQVHPDTP